MRKFEELGRDTAHPSSFSYIVPSDNYLFRQIRAFLAKTKFTKLQDVERTVSDFFDSQSSQLWEKGIAGQPTRCEIIVTKRVEVIMGLSKFHCRLKKNKDENVNWPKA